MAFGQGQAGAYPAEERGRVPCLEQLACRPRTNTESGEACWLSRTWEDTWGCAALLLVAAGQVDTVQLTERGNRALSSHDPTTQVVMSQK